MVTILYSCHWEATIKEHKLPKHNNQQQQCQWLLKHICIYHIIPSPAQHWDIRPGAGVCRGVAGASWGAGSWQWAGSACTAGCGSVLASVVAACRPGGSWLLLLVPQSYRTTACIWYSWLHSYWTLWLWQFYAISIWKYWPGDNEWMKYIALGILCAGQSSNISPA